MSRGDSGIDNSFGQLSLDPSNSSSRSGVQSSSSGHSSGGGSSSNNHSSSNPNAAIRKADMAYQHMQLATRPGPCKAARRRMDVYANHFRITTPARLAVYTYRIEFQTKGRGGYETETKKDRCEPLFWSLYKQRQEIFPRSVHRCVFDGVGAIYSLEKLNIPGGSKEYDFEVNPKQDAAPPRGGRGGRNGPPARRPPMARCMITITPMFTTEQFLEVDEVAKCQIVQLLDLIITHEMRCPLIAQQNRFVMNGHSIFKVPTSELDRRRTVRRIGKGEEVWTGLHMAVKADAPESLFLNASTSGSIFHTQNLDLVKFFAEILYDYRIPDDLNGDSIAISREKVEQLEAALKGTKVRIQRPNGDWTTKKFDRLSNQPANNLFFNCEGQGKISVAAYYAQCRQIRLRYPHFPCCSFYNKATGQTSHFPIELCTTGDEPRRFKGRLTEPQLNAFIKAVGMGPSQKRALIHNMASTTGGYIGEARTAAEWGFGVDREMVKIEKTVVLPYPDIQWGDKVTPVSSISAEYYLQDENQPRPLIQSAQKPLVLITVLVNGDGCKHEIRGSEHMSGEELDRVQSEIFRQKYEENAELFCRTLRSYGVDVFGPGYTFPYLIKGRDVDHGTLKAVLNKWKGDVANLGVQHGKDYMPCFMFVFPYRHAGLYASIKYQCDTEAGVLSQCILLRTFQKLRGNPVTNSSATNVLLKVLAKSGGVACRVDGNQFKNVGKMTTEKEATLVLGIDVTHPSREERMKAVERATGGRDPRQANQNRGRHEQMPTARPAAANLFKDINYYDCPRSVVSVVGNTDLFQTKWGVSSRIQRLGQEETVNLVEPFKDRIADFHKKTGAIPKHIIIYRDGVSDTQFRKIAYEETESMERALEAMSVKREDCTLTYICAKKRHHTRFFAVDPNEALDINGQPGGNTPPGLLVESTITSRANFDFYLQSHFGALGTAAPTHYTVIKDDWCPSQSFWQTVVFAHCFGNSRCTRPLAIPVPLHYAHFAAKRAKNNYDHFKEHAAPEEYIRAREDLAREEMEQQAITVNERLSDIDSMYFA